MATKTATPNGGSTSGGGIGNMGVAAVFRRMAEEKAQKPSVKVVEGGALTGVGTATPNGGSTTKSGSFGLAADTWKLAAKKAGIDIDELSQTEKDILRTGGVKAYQEYLWEDERAKAKK